MNEQRNLTKGFLSALYSAHIVTQIEMIYPQSFENKIVFNISSVFSREEKGSLELGASVLSKKKLLFGPVSW